MRRLFLSATLVQVLVPFTNAAPARFSPRQFGGGPNDPTVNSNNVPNQQQQGASPQIWVPVVIIIVALTLTFVFTCLKNSIMRLWMQRIRARMGGRPVDQNTQNLTADQLFNGVNAPVHRPQRRRNRRTPSQISTKSLPAYAKEPGDQELVIYRGEDSMPSPDEMSEMPNNGPVYGVGMPDTVPLMRVDSNESLDGNDAPRILGGRDTSHDFAASNHHSSMSVDTMQGSSESGAMLLSGMPNVSRVDTSGTMASSMMNDPMGDGSSSDPRGEAPAYSEVPLNGSSASGLPLPGLNQVPGGPPTATGDNNRGVRSGFRSLFNNLNPRSSIISQPGAPTDSNAPSSHRRHRASLSGSGSAINLVPFRTISRTTTDSQARFGSASQNNLTSPSVLSVNSISAPIPATLLRTEIRFPKGGPTAEQIKLISSRESFGKFGVPYGAEALARAAASRSNLDSAGGEDQPPPSFDFDQEAGGSGRILEQVSEADGEHSRMLTTSSGSNTEPRSDTFDMSMSMSLSMSQSTTSTGVTSIDSADTLDLQHVPEPSASTLRVPVGKLNVSGAGTAFMLNDSPIDDPNMMHEHGVRDGGAEPQSSVTSRADSMMTYMTATDSMRTNSQPPTPTTVAPVS